jgi:membrane protein DedA with SNARE-associated domain
MPSAIWKGELLRLTVNALGGALWVVVWTVVGFYLGKNGSNIAAVIHKLGFFGVIFVLIALTTVLICVFVYRIIGKSRSDATGKSENR